MDAPAPWDTDLIAFLSSFLRESDLEMAERILASRESSLKAEVKECVEEELFLKEVEKMESELRCRIFERESHALSVRCADLEEKVKTGEEIKRKLEEEKKRCALLEEVVAEWKKKHEQVVFRSSQLVEENMRLRSLLIQRGASLEVKFPPGVIVISDNDNQDEDVGNTEFLLTPTPKRKWRSRIVTSDTEDEDDADNIPIGKLKRFRRLSQAKEDNEELHDGRKATPSRRRRLFPWRESGRQAEESTVHSPFEEESLRHNHKGPSRSRAAVRRRLVYSDGRNGTKDKDDYEKEGDNLGGFIVSGSSDSYEGKPSCTQTSDEETIGNESGSESEGDSLGGFIVSGSSNSYEEKPSCSHDSDEETIGNGEESASDEELDGILAKIRREKEDSYKWDYEADMLASFARDPRLCMEAVCALYRMQTADEKSVKGTIELNNRGFNTCDAFRCFCLIWTSMIFCTGDQQWQSF
ncbi:hypothetical protein AXF42_Ash021011 [Apostasia shenzhenica]|uniref:Uncharacterized protein n=1 Tax=Apostasia shenzhenica TaxID=1088818 RepID=A0A2I0AEW9_9ASPA|nr:hypothetical protein AXF42_Ash021011 [Apostasia shenzhenica]